MMIVGNHWSDLADQNEGIDDLKKNDCCRIGVSKEILSLVSVPVRVDAKKNGEKFPFLSQK